MQRVLPSAIMIAIALIIGLTGTLVPNLAEANNKQYQQQLQRKQMMKRQQQQLLRRQMMRKEQQRQQRVRAEKMKSQQKRQKTDTTRYNRMQIEIDQKRYKVGSSDNNKPANHYWMPGM